MKIFIGADHNGFTRKKHLITWLKKKHIVIDCGAKTFKKNDDYPDYAFTVGKKISRSKDTLGILLCGSAAGVCIAANKVKGVRAAASSTVRDAKKMREDDHANILCISGWNTTLIKDKKIIEAFLKTVPSTAIRHNRRIKKIIAFEKK